MADIIKVEHLSYVYNPGMPNAVTALDDVSFTVEEGDFVGIIGATGSGKSTLITHMNGLNKPTSGKIYIDGRDLWEDPEKIRDFRFLTGLVFQYPEYQLFEETCYKDIAFGPKNMGLDEAEIDRRVHEAMPDVLLCAGTVLTTEQVDRAVNAGAAAIVSPGLSPDVVKYCVEKGIPVCPGTANPSDVQIAIQYGLKAVKLFPAEAVGGLKLIKSMAPVYPDMKFMPTGGINENNMLDYLAFDKILCCGGSWMVPKDAVAAKDWQRITDLTRSAVDKMLGFEVRHIGLNCPDAESSMETAKKISALMGWPIKEGNSSNFVGTGYELMKKQGRGTNGHIAIGTNSVPRAKWHLEQRGFKFIEDSAVVKNGKLIAIYLEDEIGGFAFHLVQK
jgi:2-dehydro-3-deoxyphosphogluconate aldolase/(4S)-4-hydroxy-2-oxoglutarate aldolase